MNNILIDTFLQSYDDSDRYRLTYEATTWPATPYMHYFTITITSRKPYRDLISFQRALQRWLYDIDYPSHLYGYCETHPTTGGWHYHAVSRSGILPKKDQSKDFHLHRRKVVATPEVSEFAIVKRYIDYSEKSKQKNAPDLRIISMINNNI